MVNPSVAVVILNWNGKRYLEQFLPALLRSTYFNYSIVVADNASSDDSIFFLQKTYPQIRLIELTKNHGFAGGYNKALAQVEADYYMLLNSDVEVTDDWLQPMVALLESNTAYAACQPKLLAYHDRTTFEYAGGAGGWLDLYGYPFARGRVFDVCEKDAGQYDTTMPVFWATGAALLIRQQVFKTIGGFDEYFFAHHEEIDLCWRVQLAGYELFCCPQSVVYHVGGGTLPRGNSGKTYLNFRNNQIMLWKNLPLAEKVWKIPFRLLLDQVSALKGLLGGDGGYFLAIFRAHFSFFNWMLFEKHRKLPLKLKPLQSLAGVYKGNVVWQHFVKKQSRFSSIIKKESAKRV